MKLATRSLLGAVIAATLAVPLHAGAQVPPLLRVPLNRAATGEQAPNDRLIVKYREGRQPVAAAAATTAINRAAAAFGVSARYSRTLAVGGDVMVLSRKLDHVALEAVLRQLRANPDIEYAVVDLPMRASFTPNDTYFATSYHWHLKGGAGALDMPPAWDLSQGDGVVVAVLDTGITSHPDLDANVLAGGYDFIADLAKANDGDGRDGNPADPGDWTVEEDDCGDPAPSSWHGTHVAGTIAAVTHNAFAVSGVAFDSRVLPVRVLGTCGGSMSDVADAIVWASGGTVTGVPANANPAEVLNLSLGGTGSCSAPLQAAINGARSRGSVVVVAAGNEAGSVEDHTPANCSGVITVASSDQGGTRSSFSNAGAGIDVTAPGGGPGILSTMNVGTEGPGEAVLGIMEGTSMAAPHVAGVVALMQAANVHTPTAVESKLKLTATPMSGANCPGLCGAGVVNAYAAIRSATGIAYAQKAIELRNAVAQAVADGTANQARRFVITTSADVSALKFRLAGGTGNADLFVRRGSQPSTTVYDCRGDAPGNVEECVIPTPVGNAVYHVMVRGTTAFADASVTAVYNTRRFYTGIDLPIRDVGASATSTIRAHTLAGNAPATLKVAVKVYHPRSGDVRLELLAPDGTVYLLKAQGASATPNIITEYTVDASSEIAKGNWQLRARDYTAEEVGHVDEWSLTF